VKEISFAAKYLHQGTVPFLSTVSGLLPGVGPEYLRRPRSTNLGDTTVGHWSETV